MARRLRPTKTSLTNFKRAEVNSTSGALGGEIILDRPDDSLLNTCELPLYTSYLPVVSENCTNMEEKGLNSYTGLVSISRQISRFVSPKVTFQIHHIYFSNCFLMTEPILHIFIAILSHLLICLCKINYVILQLYTKIVIDCHLHVIFRKKGPHMCTMWWIRLWTENIVTILWRLLPVNATKSRDDAVALLRSWDKRLTLSSRKTG